MDKIDRQFSAMRGELDGILGALEAAANGIRLLNTRFDGLHDALDDEFTAERKRLDGLEGRVEALEKRVPPAA